MKKQITGHLFEGVQISDEQVSVQATLNQLETIGLKSPWESAKTTLKNTDRDQQPFKELRNIVQRAWDKPRSDRADLYSEYMWNIFSGKIKGGTPPIMIFSPNPATLAEDASTLVLPFRGTVIAIDGETQLEARYRMRALHPETGDWPFASTIYHGITEQHAIQILHDVNHYAKPIPETKLGSRNSSGGISISIAEALAKAGLKIEDINRQGNGGTNKLVAAFSQLMYFIAGYALGNPKGLDANGASYFEELNRPGTPPVNGNCSDALAAMLAMAHAKDVIRRTASQFWQVAGILAQEGVDLTKLDWAGAIANDKATAALHKGQGGARIPRAERQRQIYADLRKPVAVAAE